MEHTKRKSRADIQHRYIKTKRLEELRHRYIVSISGYDPQTGLSISSVRMLPTEEFLCLIESLSYDCNKQLRQIQIQLNNGRAVLDYSSLRMGAVACVPIPLMVNLLRDLKDQKRQYAKMEWKNISKKDYEKKGMGKYFMFHWGRGSSFTGYEVDWKVNNVFLGLKSQELVDDLACQVVKNFRNDQSGKTPTEVLGKFSVFPGCVMTELAYDQRAHIDMSTWGIIVHMPLCEEGMLIHIWSQGSSRTLTGKFIHVPFGSFLALPAHSVHSGVYGSSGNLRFHMLIRERENSWLADKLHDDDSINKNMTKRRNWKSELKTRLNSGVASFAKQYIDTLRLKCGSVFFDKWTKNIYNTIFYLITYDGRSGNKEPPFRSLTHFAVFL
jgi:hypothetical protein